MEGAFLHDWFDAAPLLLLAVGAAVLMVVALSVGMALRNWSDRRPRTHDQASGEGMEGVFVSAVLGMLALLMGFTFSIALNRFEDRRALVLQEANSVGTTFLRTQLLDEPHRTRISGLLVAYTDNRIALGEAAPDRRPPLRAANDRLINDLWAATSAASASLQDRGLTTPFLTSMNELIDLEAARRVARGVKVPTEVFMILFVYLVVTAGIMGFVSIGRRERIAVTAMFFLLTLSLLMILDVDRPTSGWIREDQGPMKQLKGSLRAQTPALMDHFIIEDAQAAGTPVARGDGSRVDRAAPSRTQGLTR